MSPVVQSNLPAALSCCPAPWAGSVLLRNTDWAATCGLSSLMLQRVGQLVFVTAVCAPLTLVSEWQCTVYTILHVGLAKIIIKSLIQHMLATLTFKTPTQPPSPILTNSLYSTCPYVLMSACCHASCFWLFVLVTPICAYWPMSLYTAQQIIHKYINRNVWNWWSWR